jgi:hypothetical protein
MNNQSSKTMFGSSAHSQLFTSIATLIIVALSTAAYALPIAATKHPATVPDGYVITPFGYFHPSCVNQLAKGDILHQDEKAIEHANGTFDKIAPCAYSHYRADGEEVTGDEKNVRQPDISHAWIEYASVHDTADYGQVYGEWDVPASPSDHDGQTVYLFNGLEDINDVVTIIQPVLGWNSDYGDAWGIAAWNCCVNGQVNEAPPAHVNPGDHLLGYTYNNCSAGTKTCGSWNIVIVDEQNGSFSQMIDETNYGQTFNWAFAGVLEVYNIAQCGDYPPPDYVGGIGFYNQSVLNDKFDVITPAWKVSNVSGGLTPQCNYGGSLPKQVVLTY